MSADLYDKDGLRVTKFAGPVPPDGDRRRIQLTLTDGPLITLSWSQWEALGEWFTRDCSPSCEGPHLDLTWDKEVT